MPVLFYTIESSFAALQMIQSVTSKISATTLKGFVAVLQNRQSKVLQYYVIMHCLGKIALIFVCFIFKLTFAQTRIKKIN